MIFQPNIIAIKERVDKCVLNLKTKTKTKTKKNSGSGVILTLRIMTGIRRQLEFIVL